jgi:tol-pal system protein YbgF
MRALKPLVQAQLRPLALAVVALLGTSAARAGLLEDDDARRAILELRQQRTQDGDALTAKLQELHAQIDGLKRSLLDMNAQIELVRSDLAKERGQNEVLARDLAEVQRRQKDMQQSMDERARKLEPVAVNLDGKAFKAEPEEKRQFDDALTKMRSQDYAAAAATLNALLQRYPATGYRESAHYWLGNAYYGASQFNEAIGAFRQLIAMSPDHARSPESMLSIANCYSELKDAKQLRKTLDEVIKQYPQSEAAQAAKDRIASTAALAAQPAPAASTGSAKSKTRK